MDNYEAIEALTKQVGELQLQLNERAQEVESLRLEMAELREATQTLSTWVERLAESFEKHTKH
jgi:hypothetical protein